MSETPETPETPVGWRWWTLVAVCTGLFMLLVDITIVNVALPDIQRDLDASLSDLQWVIDAYALSLAALLLTCGSLADLYGRRRVFAIGTALFTVGSLLCGFAPSLVFLCVSRAAQGIGGAAMFATALALLAASYAGRDRGVAFGAFGATAGVAIALGPVLGGVLTSGISWRWIFFVNLPICLFALAVTLGRVRESRDPGAGRPDLVGFVTFSGALGLLVFGLIEAGSRANPDGWGSGLVLGSLLVAGLLMVTFVVAQRRRPDPMLDLGLLRKPTFTGGLVAAFGVSASVFSLLTYVVIYIQNVLGFSAVDTGVRLLFLSGGSFVAAAVAGRLTALVPTKWLISPGFVVLGVGLLLIHGIEPGDSWTGLIPGLVVAGLGTGMINPPLASTAVGVVAPAQAGMASGVNNTARQVGIATGIAALGSIFANRVVDGVRSSLAGTPGADRADQIAGAVTGGQLDALLAQVPAGARQAIADAATTGFVDALNDIAMIAVVIAFASALLTGLLIRQRDFVVPQEEAGDETARDPGEASETESPAVGGA